MAESPYPVHEVIEQSMKEVTPVQIKTAMKQENLIYSKLKSQQPDSKVQFQAPIVLNPQQVKVEEDDLSESDSDINSVKTPKNEHFTQIIQTTN